IAPHIPTYGRSYILIVQLIPESQEMAPLMSEGALVELRHGVPDGHMTVAEPVRRDGILFGVRRIEEPAVQEGVLLGAHSILDDPLTSVFEIIEELFRIDLVDFLVLGRVIIIELLRSADLVVLVLA